MMLYKMSTYFYAQLYHCGAGYLQIFVIVLSDLLAILGLAMIFKKAEKKPYLALIPGVRDHVLFGIAWRSWIGDIVAVLKAVLFLLFPANGRLLASGTQGLICFAAFFLLLGLTFVMKWKLALSFRKSVVFAFYLTFLQQVFYLLLGFDKSEYLGPTLRHHEQREEKEDEQAMSSGQLKMISLNKQRSIVAFVSAFIVCVCTFYAVAIGLLETAEYIQRDTGYSLFKYFTTNSNTLSAIGAAFLIPYAVEGIRVKRFSFPKWVGMIQYSGASCTTLTMMFAFLFILPTQGMAYTFGGTNFWLHLICPVMAIVLFLSVESDFRFTFYDSIVCLAPFFIYAGIYMLFVEMVGREYGGWQDLYHLVEWLPVSFSAPVMCAFALGVGLLIRYAYNRLSIYRRGKMIRSFVENTDAVEVEKEARDLGRHYGLYDDRNDMTIPVDILQELSKKYGVQVQFLYRSYVRGMDEGLKEREKNLQRHPGMLTSFFGTPRDLVNKQSS